MEQPGRAPTGKSTPKSAREGACARQRGAQGGLQKARPAGSSFPLCDEGQRGLPVPTPGPPPFPPDGLIGGDPAHAFLCLSPQAFSQGEGGVEHSERGCLACKAPRTYPLTLCREGCALPGWMGSAPEPQPLGGT